MNKIVFTGSDLPINNGKIYHLDITPEQLAKDIIIVGDPERVPVIADEFFETVEVDHSHRGLRTMTGIVKGTGLRVTVLTSGMGTPSTEIVINEIMALNEVDFVKRERKETYDMINMIRIGSTGGLRAETKIGIPIITSYALGLDNTGLFYDAPVENPKCEKMEKLVQKVLDSHIRPESRFKGKIHPYVSKTDDKMLAASIQAANELEIAYKEGITVSSSGFFANQGRDVSKIPPTIIDIDRILANLDSQTDGLHFENMEMEASFILHYMNGLGYRAGAICVVVANRFTNEFNNNYVEDIKNATKIALKTLDILRKKY